MIKSYNFNLNKFLKNITLKKQYMKKLIDKTVWLTHVKEHNYKHTSYNLFLSNPSFKEENSLITYIIYISFSHSNTSLHITDFSGALKFSCLAGNLSFKGKNKKARNPVLKAIIKVIRKKFKMLQRKPVALHLKNVGRKKRFIIKKLGKELSIQVIKCFSLYPYNGCRRKKIRRRKFKKKRLKRNGWAVQSGRL